MDLVFHSHYVVRGVGIIAEGILNPFIAEMSTVVGLILRAWHGLETIWQVIRKLRVAECSWLV